MKIIVTGALGVVGRGVGNSIRASARYAKAEVIGLDTMYRKLGTGSRLYDKLYKVPRCDDQSYKARLEQILDRETPDAVITTPEIEFIKHCEFGVSNELLAPLTFTEVAISKRRLMDALDETGFTAKTCLVSRVNLDEIERFIHSTSGHVWLRAVDDNTTGGAAARKCGCSAEVLSWISEHTGYSEFQLSEYLPGRNLACTMIYKNGKLISAINAERINYMLAHLVPSGITGYTDYGKVFKDDDLVSFCQKVIEHLPGHRTLSGAITVDLKEAADGAPKVTEVNLRYIGFVYAYALAGYNIVQDHIDCILGEDPISRWSGPVREFYRAIDSELEVY